MCQLSSQDVCTLCHREQYPPWRVIDFNKQTNNFFLKWVSDRWPHLIVARKREEINQVREIISERFPGCLNQLEHTSQRIYRQMRIYSQRIYKNLKEWHWNLVVVQKTRSEISKYFCKEIRLPGRVENSLWRIIESLYRADFSFQRLLLFEDKKINVDAKNSSFYFEIET